MPYAVNANFTRRRRMRVVLDVFLQHRPQRRGVAAFPSGRLAHLHDKAARPSAHVPPPLPVPRAMVICGQRNPLLLDRHIGCAANICAADSRFKLLMQHCLALEDLLILLQRFLEVVKRVKDGACVQQRSAAAT
jgi:hypothetical protein